MGWLLTITHALSSMHDSNIGNIIEILPRKSCNNINKVHRVSFLLQYSI
jgi:hypothetical protein